MVWKPEVERLAPRAKGKGQREPLPSWFPDEIFGVQRDKKEVADLSECLQNHIQILGRAVSSLPSALVLTCLLRSENIPVKIRARRSRTCSDGCRGFLSTFYYSKQRFITAPGCDRS